MRRYAKVVVLQILRAYRWAISPMLPPSCRFVPTCSEYAMEAVDRYGVLRGSFMALIRLLRCHPLARGGYDPVVKERTPAKWKSSPLGPRQTTRPQTGFSPRGLSQHLKRNA